MAKFACLSIKDSRGVGGIAKGIVRSYVYVVTSDCVLAKTDVLLRIVCQRFILEEKGQWG